MISLIEWDYLKVGDLIYWAHPFSNKVHEMKITEIRNTAFDSVLTETGKLDKNTAKAFHFLFSDAKCANTFLNEYVTKEVDKWSRMPK